MAQVKTAISIPAPLFEQVDDLAKQMQISRSQLFAMAMEAFLEQHRNRWLLDQLNAVYRDEPDPAERAELAQLKKRHGQRLEDEEPW